MSKFARIGKRAWSFRASPVGPHRRPEQRKRAQLPAFRDQGCIDSGDQASCHGLAATVPFTAMSDREIEAALRQIRPDKTDAFPLGALNGIRVLRGYLEELEPLCIERSLDLGASVEDVADALGITKQGVYYKIRRIAEGDAGSNAEEDEAVS